MNKKQSIEAAIAQIPDGASIMVGGFGSPGTPFSLIDELVRQGQRNLTLIKNDANEVGIGISRLIENGQVDKLISTHIGLNRCVIDLMNSGKLSVEFYPQGIFAEKIRTAGAGSFGFLSDIGLDSEITQPEQILMWQGTQYKVEMALSADFALIHAAQADTAGNLVYRGTAINFSPLMAMAADQVIVETADCRSPGELVPETIHTPSAFVSSIVELAALNDNYGSCKIMSDTNAIIQRAVQEIRPGNIVNLGIGLPTQVLDCLPEDLDVLVHAENGVLGAWKQADSRHMNPFLIDSAGTYISTRPGSAFFDSAVSFAMVRRGKLDLTMIGAFEVDEAGNLANWKIPGKFSPGIGGAMELAQKTPRIVVLTTHCDKHGNPKILRQCRLPITAKGCVSRIITEKAVIDVEPQGLVVREKLQDISNDELQTITEASLIFANEPEV